MLEHNAAHFGARAALLGDGKKPLSHRQLRDQAAETVSALNRLGVGRGDRVAIVLPQGPDLAAAFLALAAGATAAPLNPAYVEKEYAFYLQDLQARALILPQGRDSPARAAAGSLGVPVIELVPAEDGAGRFHLSGASRALATPGGFAQADDVALVLHTSGTTSRPKMVPLTHANLLASVRHVGAALHLQPTDRCLNVMPLFHVHGLVAGLLASLGAGGSTVCTRAFAAEEFPGWLKEWEPSWYSAVPTMHQAILAHAQALPVRPLRSSLRFIRSSSAALPPLVMAGLEEAFGVPVIESYGMTEAAHQIASNPLPPRVRKPGSVGLAAGPGVAILDEAGATLAGGRTGEVAVFGPNVTDGYANEPEANATAFCGGWLRTGDQGYLDADGYLFITGRLKELINRGGEKIAPREIEEVLLRHPAVRQAVAFAVPHPSLGEDIAAAVVPKDGAVGREAELREFALDRLPAFKVPTRIIFVHDVPEGPTGKLQRVGLADRLAAALVVVYEAPTSATERLVATTICEVLGREMVGRNDNFFSLGGDSLRAMQVLTRLERSLGLEIPVTVMFRCPTPALLADKLDLMSESAIAALATEPGKLPPEENPRVAVYPASHGQQRMWYLHHYVQESPVYCVASAFHIVGPLNVAWLAAAFDAVIQRHDMLRTTFAMDNGELFQRVAASSTFQLQQVDLEAIPADARKASAERCLDEETCRPFDLAAGPPFRAVLVRSGPTEHVLLLVLHHIIGDGWSRSNFCCELSDAYQLLATGRPAPMRELPVQYADYSAWQRDRLGGGTLETQTAYWRTKLAAEPEPLDLPSDRPRPATVSFRGGRCSRRLDPGLTSALRARAQEEGATLFMILLAAFKTLLHRYTGHGDLIVGVPVANRQRVEAEGLIGLFANTLAMRTTFPAELTFRELLRRVKETAVEAYANQDVPFERLVELLRVRRDASRTPLFQATFALQDFPEVAIHLPGAQTAPWFVTTHTSKFDLSLIVEPAAEGWMATAEYSTDLFEAGRVERMLDHWLAILASVVANPAQRVSEIPILTAPERQQVLVEWNRSERDYPRDLCVHQLFEKQVERTPDATAVVFERNTLTYRELDARSDQLAAHLHSLGVGPEILVGVCLERSLDMVAALLGILKAGGAYVPLDPRYPQERLQFILRDAEPKVLLTQRALAGKFLDSACRLVHVDEPLPGSDPGAQVRTSAPGQLAYLIYTSGSTGVPKGVAIEHHSAVSFLHWVREAFTDEELSGVLAATSICFDLSIFELFGPLCWGGKCILVGSARELVACPQRHEVRLVNTVPSVMQTLLDAEALPASVITVNLAGEPLHPSLVDALYARGHVRRVNDLYGPSETTTYSTSAARAPNQPATIGRPIANTQVYLLDAGLVPVPIGVTGELWIGGEGVARGYWRRQELTAERFIPDPFRNGNGRLYRTGDLARWRPDGQIEYWGRADHQVKLRGFRIELGEVEAVLAAHPAVSACATGILQDPGGDKRLTAFVATRDGAALPHTELRSWLGEKLPDHMVPSQFVHLAVLPLMPNGKVDRQALERMAGVEPAGEVRHAAPQSETERALAQIWQAVLRREQLGVEDNFFDVGGHSLLAMVMGARIGRELGMEVPLSWVFEHPTIGGLARRLESLSAERGKGIGIPKADRRVALPGSFAQQGMWLVRQSLPDAATYNVALAWRLCGPVQPERVQRALQAILQRHEVLRTALVQRAGSLVQQIADARDVVLPWREADLRALPAGDREGALQARLVEEARRPFDLACAPLWRVAWFELGEDERVLAFTFDHSIVDEWSLRLFCEELQRLYALDGQAAGSDLAALPVQYADYACWQRQRLTAELRESHRAYWKEQLKDLPAALDLPTDRVRPPRPSGRGAVHDFELSGAVVARLRKLAREEGSTLFTVVLAAFQVWLHRYTGQRDVVVATPLADRQQPEVQSLIGYFLNTLPIRVQVEGRLSFREVLRRVHAALLAAYSHADLPFEQIVEVAVKDRAPGREPLYQVMFVLLEEAPSALRLDAVRTEPLAVQNGTSRNDLLLIVDATANSLACRIEYPLDLYNGDTVARMGGHLTQLLHSIADDAAQSVSHLQLMPPAERHRILVEWNRTQRDYPRERCIHEVFEEQTKRTPDAIAVVCESQSLTYHQLNLQANRLARHLRQLGVRPGDLVALRIERSLPMVVGLLGILKAGGTYWALEEALPEERLQGMLADARPRVLLLGRTKAPALAAVLNNAQAEAPALCAVAMIEDLLQSAAEDDQALDSSVTASSPAYLNYTSGSTGQPKGVLVPHRGVVRLAKGAEPLALSADETLLHLSSIAFDASTFELWGALLNGGRVVLLPRGRPSLQDIGDAIRRHAITTLFLGSGLFHLMLDERPDDLRSLRRLITGGDVLSPGHVKKALRLLPGCRVINAYGPTENTTFTCSYLAADEANLDSGVPIGRPIANTQVYVLDADLQPVPVGVAGELYAGGDGVACGYLNQPQLTAQRFIADPFSSTAGARLYRTGDRARWRPDGNLEFLGRMDTQVKIRGFRVELGEIEAALRAVRTVSAAAVAAGDPGPDGRRLVAHVVTVGNAPLDEAELKAALKARLPDYMIPSQFVQLAALPLTPYGKVDRKSLPWPDRDNAGAEHERVMPRDDLERKVAQAFEKTLGLQCVGAHGNFFDLGGHSLQVLRLLLELEQSTGRTLPVSAVFRSQTVEQIAALLREKTTPPGLAPMLPLKPEGGKPPFFIVHPGSGADYYYSELLPRLDADLPVYALQPPGFDGRQPPCRSVEDMAARLIDEMLTVQPTGPFALGGVSYGGVIAWEIAGQLHARGHGLSFVALFDTHCPAFGRQAPSHSDETRRAVRRLAARWKSRIRFHASALALLAPREIPRYLSEISARALSPGLRARAAARWKRPRSPTIQEVNDAVARCRENYVPPPFAGPVHLFRAQIQDSIAPKPRDLGWSGRALGGIVIHDVPGWHSSIVREPHVRALCSSLHASLEAWWRSNGRGGLTPKASATRS